MTKTKAIAKHIQWLTGQSLVLINKQAFELMDTMGIESREEALLEILEMVRERNSKLKGLKK